MAVRWSIDAGHAMDFSLGMQKDGPNHNGAGQRSPSRLAVELIGLVHSSKHSSSGWSVQNGVYAPTLQPLGELANREQGIIDLMKLG